MHMAAELPSLVVARGPVIALENLGLLVESLLPHVAHVAVEGGNGSGFVLGRHAPSGQLAVVTNAHVVHSSTRCEVSIGSQRPRPAVVVSADLHADLAVLLCDSPEEGLGVPLRVSSAVQVGEPVIAIGSPYGLTSSVSLGIVSARDRTRYAPSGAPVDNMLQTDALINPGNSGGPLVGFDGAVVGVNTQVERHHDHTGALSGLGFAIPTDAVASIVEQVLYSESGVVRRASIGVRVRDADLPEAMGDRLGQVRAAVVTFVHDWARDSAIAEGDLIVRFRGEMVDEAADLFRLLDHTCIGAEHEVSVIRDEEEVTLYMRAVERAALP